VGAINLWGLGMRILNLIETMELKTDAGNFAIRRCGASQYRKCGFDKQHYRHAALSKSAQCYLVSEQDNPAVFVALLPNPCRGKRNVWRISRFAILPEYQGKGLALSVLNFFGEQVKRHDCQLTISTGDAMFAASLLKSKTWTMSVFKRETANCPYPLYSFCYGEYQKPDYTKPVKKRKTLDEILNGTR